MALKHVQYGRVTTALSGRSLSDFKDGLRDHSKVVAYGRFGQDGTEDHYFARGVDNTTEQQINALESYYGQNKMVFKGHAVAYGIDNNFVDMVSANNSGNSNMPTAIDQLLPTSNAEYGLYSGNHVLANVDLSTNRVDGMVYNVWAALDNRDKAKFTNERYNAKLVDFSGSMAKNGNIAGTARNLTKENAPGIFNAALFGEHADEMGGTIVSAQPEKVQWGLSFGAKNRTEIHKNPKPAQKDNLSDVANNP